ncbi:MAG: hypothetical protein MRZ79_16695 [Bacteroidia bacterium]|nr:hypothetical protein [Bacteroidia bacterium]
MNFRNLAILFIAFSVVVFLPSCTPEEPGDGEEEITSVVLTFDNGVGQIKWTEGGSAPDITLDANTTYTVSVEFLNESDPNDVEDVTEEIKEEDDEHIVCYDVTSADVAITRTDSDGTFEVGLATSWVTGDASNGTVVLDLRHQPEVKDGSCTPGDSDVEVEFNVTIQ